MSRSLRPHAPHKPGLLTIYACYGLGGFGLAPGNAGGGSIRRIRFGSAYKTSRYSRRRTINSSVEHPSEGRTRMTSGVPRCLSMVAPVAARMSPMRALDVPSRNCTSTSPGTSCSADCTRTGANGVCDDEFCTQDPTTNAPLTRSGTPSIEAGRLRMDIDTGTPSSQRELIPRSRPRILT